MRTENLHLTLAFLGDLDEGRVAEAERAAAEVAPRAAVLVLDRPGYWKHNRIAWAGASAVPGELEALVHELRNALASSRIGFDAKGFAVHVTLVRDAREPRAMPKLEPVAWKFDGFALVRSAMQPGASRYELLGSWGFRKRC